MPSGSRIRVLSEGLANQIAAGEVVQRPSSVLKELIENSLDAGSRSIWVGIESGGSRRIRVRDDGGGMGRDDALLAFERHATSKIATEADLNEVTTLGFRGEALASIAAVSKVVLTTRRRGEVLGTEVRIDGGRISRVLEMGAPEGTAIDIHALFYNVPARRKFLKTKNTELSRCVEVVSQAAMAHPDTAIILHHGGRTILDLKSAESRLDRTAELLGKEVLPHLIELAELEREDVRLSGWVGAPTLTRSNRAGQFFFVNGRPVRDRLMVHAVLKAYRSFLPGGRQPVFSFFLDVPPGEVDVNVHPGKEEVRFRRSSLVHDFIHDSVAAKLGGGAQASRLIVHKTNGLESPLPSLGRSHPGRAGGGREITLLGGGGYFSPVAEEGSHHIRETTPETFFPEVMEAATNEAAVLQELPTGSFPLDRVLVPPDPSYPVLFSECRYLGQWAECFLLFESAQGLVFMDQHAAHERVLYNHFRAQFRAGEVERQVVLVPQRIALRPEEALLLDEHRETLTRSGFDLEPAGAGEYLIRSVPALLADRNPAGAVSRVVEGLADFDDPMSFPDLIDGIIARMSCRRAVKASRPLHPEEVASLAEEIDKTPGRWTCPHGRPIMLLLTVDPVRRRFLR